MPEPKREFMEVAIKEARVARNYNKYPIGAAIVLEDNIIASSPARVDADIDSTQHAEVAAIRLAEKKNEKRFLEGTVLYTTHEPCPMCASAAIMAKMSGIVFGAALEDMKELGWRVIDIPAKEVLEKGSPKLFIVEGFMREECKNL